MICLNVSQISAILSRSFWGLTLKSPKMASAYHEPIRLALSPFHIAVFLCFHDPGKERKKHRSF